MEHLKRILLLLGMALSLTGPSGAAETGGWPDYPAWRTACRELPSNRSLAGRFPERDALPLRTFAEFERALDAFLHVSTNAPLGDLSNWIGEPPEPEVFFNTGRAWFLNPPIPFQPFAQKLVLPDDAIAIIQGDLHGDVRSLLQVLDRLNDQEVLDGFKIRTPNHHLFFTGDFTDRGAYGIEVLYTLFRLKIANPARVHLARGNHEDLELVRRYGFFLELQSKYGRTANVAKLLRAYDFLPVVIYAGTEEDFVQLNHGGMEPGYDPRELISTAGTIRYQLLGRLNQRSYHERHAGWLDGDPASPTAAETHLRDFTPMAPTLPHVIGFMWNDFTVFSDEPAFGYDPGRAFVYGRTATRHLLKTSSTSRFKIHAVIRAHQHSGIINPMMRRLIAGDGVFRHWQDTDRSTLAESSPSELRRHLETSETRSIPEGSVWTFNVAPDSVYGMGCDFDFVTYGELAFRREFKDWTMGIHRLTVPDAVIAPSQP